MKKILIILLFSISLIFTACTDNNSVNPSIKPNDNPDKEVENNISGNKYLLGAYGDYAYYKDETKDVKNLESEIKGLAEIIKGQANDIYESKYQKGLLNFFDITNEIKFTININDSELKKLNSDHEINNKETYRVCNVDIELNGIIYHYENVGIRQKGNTSRGHITDGDGNINLRHYKLSFQEEFDDEYRGDKFTFKSKEAQKYQKDRTFFGLEKLNIRWNKNKDATYLKEFYSYEMYRANKVLAPRSNLVNVLMDVDGVKQNLGVYLAIEDINKAFLKRNLKENYTKGDLYKLGWSYEGARLDRLDNNLIGIEEQIKYDDKYSQINFPYDLKTNKKTSKHEQLKAFLSKAINTSVDGYYNFFKNDTIYESVINYLAVSYLLGDTDDLRGNYNNTFMYFVNGTNKMLLIPTDNDRSLGSTGGTGNPTNHHGVYNEPFDNQTGYSVNDSKFFERSIFENGNSNIKNDYVKAISQVINNGWMNISKFESYYNKAYNNYKDDLNLGNRINGDKIEFNLIEANNVSDGWNLSTNEYMRLKVETFNNFISDPIEYSQYYFRGNINGWSYSKQYQLKIINGIPTIELYLENSDNCCFKVANSDWSIEFNYNDLYDGSICESVGDHKNIKVNESGYYLLEIITVDNEEVLKLTKIS